YFKNENGVILLIPSDEEARRFRKQMDKRGYILCAAETLAEARKLQKTLQEQMKREQELELAKDEAMTSIKREQVRARLTARMNSASCPEFERDFIALWLKMREHKHDLFKKKFTSELGHLDALEWDDPDKHIH